MKLLLDTHVLLWALARPSALPRNVASEIVEGANDVLVSAATAWEIAIKRALGKLEAPSDLRNELDEKNFTELPITIEHAMAAGALPRHHSDPFDRMLVAQAQLEGATLVTADPRLSAYGVPVLAVA